MSLITLHPTELISTTVWMFDICVYDSNDFCVSKYIQLTVNETMCNERLTVD